MPYLDYIAPPAGGSIRGFSKQASGERGFVNSQTEGAWIATFIFVTFP